MMINISKIYDLPLTFRDCNVDLLLSLQKFENFHIFNVFIFMAKQLTD